MSRPNLLLGILILLVIENVGWADHRPRCGLGLRRGIHARIFPRIPSRKGCIEPSSWKPEPYVALAWKLEQGKPFYQEMTTETFQRTTVLGQSFTQQQKVTFFLSWTPIGKDRNGNWKVKQKIEGLRIEIEVGGNKIPFDSTKNGAGVNPLSDFFKALIGSEFLLTLDNNMKISKIEGRGDFLKKLTKENQGMAPLLKSILSDEALKQMSDPAFALIPNKAVKKGDSWELKNTLDMGSIGTFYTIYRCTYEGADENDLQMIRVNPRLEYKVPGANVDGALPFKFLKADLTSTDCKGDILFDSQKGRVVYSNMTMNLSGTMTIEISGNPSEVTIDQTQTTTVKTSDENPIPKKSS
jgi:hypothetical protein